MNSYDNKDTSVGERRRATRRDSDVHLQVELGAVTLEGQAENISSAGVFFFSGDPLTVKVRLHDSASSREYSGKLVRVERMSAETTGYAIEFDRL